MTKRLEIYNPNKTYMFPSMAVATPERVMAEYEAVNHFACVIETDEAREMFYAIEPLRAMRNRMGIDPELSDAEALALMEEIINTPQEFVATPSAEERIAAAIEFQTILLMPNEMEV